MSTQDYDRDNHDQASQDDLFGPSAPTPKRVVHDRRFHRELGVRCLGGRKRNRSHEPGEHLPSVTVSLETFQVPPVKTSVA